MEEVLYYALKGDCLEVLKERAPASIDSLVTDPPAGISFMGKGWDGDKGGRCEWIKWMTEGMRECLRVMKPGAHGLVWALPRTSHWTATALEDAGFEIRDKIFHHFGTGFPKSLDISKAIDKAAGAIRVNGPVDPTRSGRPVNQADGYETAGGWSCGSRKITIDPPATDAAKQWAGWGTALKPSTEEWVLIRKPYSEKTVVANVLKWGTGALNIDASRVQRRIEGDGQGRFPANLILDEEAAALLDEQSGERVSGSRAAGVRKGMGFHGADGDGGPAIIGSTGGASRFFYCAKPSKAEKNKGCDMGVSKSMGNRPNSGDMTGKFPDHDQRERVGNFHPTVKSTSLMSYLIKLVTPPGGVVLDPFMGSGSTGVAAKEHGFKFVGIERDEDYFGIAKQRIEERKDLFT